MTPCSSASFNAARSFWDASHDGVPFATRETIERTPFADVTRQLANFRGPLRLVLNLLGKHNRNMTSPALTPPLPPLLQELVPDFEIEDPFDAPSLRWGIIGTGGIARRFASEVPKFSSQRVVAVGSRSLEQAQEFAQEFGIGEDHAFGSYQELVADPQVDAVYVATPHIRHRDDALLALAQGKPVLVEKAFTMSEEEAREVFDAAQEADLFAMEAMWSRHLPHYRFLKELTDSGALGEVRSVAADHSQSLLHVPRLVEPELGGGAMLDLGVYPLHFINMLLGPADSVVAAGRLTDKAMDAGSATVLSYPDATGVATIKMDALGPNSGTIAFERGLVELSGVFYAPSQITVTVWGEPGEEPRTASWDARTPGGFQFQVAEAARQIAAGNNESPVVPWDATLEVQGAMDEALAQLGYLGR